MTKRKLTPSQTPIWDALVAKLGEPPRKPAPDYKACVAEAWREKKAGAK